jgi:hypothetical protein
MGFRFTIDNVENRAVSQMYDFVAKMQYGVIVLVQNGNTGQL